MMSVHEKNVGKLVLTALISYVATNADDLIILMNFFTEISLGNSSMKVHHVFIGQYFGFFILLIISLTGYLISFVLPIEMLGFLGFLPIFIGLKNILDLIIEFYKKRKHGTIDDIIPTDSPVSTIQLEMIRCRNDVDGSIRFEIKKQTDEQKPATNSNRIFSILNHLFSLETLKVTSITLANSADNISIYTPLFAQAYQWQIIVYIIIFLVMVFVWLMISYYFINSPPILSLAQKCARYLVPIVFLGIGIYIVVSSECFLWLFQAIRTKNFQKG
ncbi:unnamed protein product [Adineta ricciae]|uniref:Cadmium resistance transporter n=1 Tax=Adineta ricciae TaxID=249248 RepID=A0A815QE10_ADIRI|nr:unnamed protein product [Adineta ricciae]